MNTNDHLQKHYPRLRRKVNNALRIDVCDFTFNTCNYRVIESQQCFFSSQTINRAFHWSTSGQINIDTRWNSRWLLTSGHATNMEQSVSLFACLGEMITIRYTSWVERIRFFRKFYKERKRRKYSDRYVWIAGNVIQVM